MYKYIHTTSSVIPRGKKKDILKYYVHNYLYSLYYAFSVEGFGLDSLKRFAENKIKVFYNNLYKGEELYIDSSGFSIISGDVKPEDIQILIECYHSFMKNYKDFYHKILSLDIPIFLEHPEYNTKESIYRYNYKSISYSKSLLEKDNELYDKFIFVWHFKIKDQFDIWRNIYDQFFKKDYKLNKFAVGGLVSLRGVTNIKYSPFIAPVYRILKHIEERGNYNKEYLIHILGVYGHHDRFFMCFMDKLINQYYFKDYDFNTNITFDTINYQVSGFFKSRHFPLFEMLGCNPLKYEESKYKKWIEKLFPEEYVQKELLLEIDNIKNDRSMKDMEFFSLTYTVYSQLIDFSMKKFMEEENLLELFLEHKNYNQLRNKLSPVLDRGRKKYPFALKAIKNNLLSNFFWLSNFHKAWVDGADLERIDKGINHFIKDINFPAKLG